MPVNKLALIRYKTIDKCLQNRFRKWTLADLIDAVSEAIYEYEGIDSGVSKRTIQLDIQNMRSDKLGYNAPIVVEQRRYYTYEDKEFSITKSRLSHSDLEVLQDTVKLLGQFQGFNYFEDLGAIIGKLEDKVSRQQKQTTKYVDIEKNERLVGLNWIDILLRAVKTNTVIEIEYQSFKARNPKLGLYSPYLLKEYRNRWFLLCRPKGKMKTLILALDRMKSIALKPEAQFKVAEDFIPQEFFNNVIGVTKSLNQATSKVVLEFDKSNAPYVLTKPLHPSQELLKKENGSIIVSINVVLNFELEREILGFGDSVKVLAPRVLSKRIIEKLNSAVLKYDE